jgi:small-conductance mechanosensitive channel
MNDALPELDSSWLQPRIANLYETFVAYAMNEVLIYNKVPIEQVPGGVDNGNNYVMILSPEKDNFSIYLENVYDAKKDAYIWMFPRYSQYNAVQLYLNSLPLDLPRESFMHYKMDKDRIGPNRITRPINYEMNTFLWDNIPSAMYSYGVAGYITNVSVFALTLMYVLYRIFYLISAFLLSLLIRYTKKGDNKYIKQLSISISANISIYLASSFFISSLILFWNIIFYLDIIFNVVDSLLLAFLFTRLVNITCSLIEAYYAKTRGDGSSARFAFAIDISNKLVNIVVIIFVSGYVVNMLGVDLFHFATALGIGGLAIALAGKHLIENIFGSIVLASERPIKLGDWIVIDNQQGNVEKIGLRSTIIRAFDDSVIVIPNYMFISGKINNKGARNYRRYMTQLEVDENTSPTNLKAYVDRLNQLVHDTDKMKKDGFYIRINEITNSSVNILIYVFFLAEDWGDELQQREDFIVRVLEIANEMDVKLAPTQTLHINPKSHKDE